MKSIFIVLFCIIAVGGLFVGLFEGTIQRALTLSPQSGNRQPATAAQPPMKTSATAQATTNTTPTLNTPTILAQDSFQRMDQALWGTASDGNSWNGDANNQQLQNAFSITGKVGVITNTQGTLNALLGPTLTNAEVLASGSLSRFGGIANFGLVLRWTDKNHWYKAYIDGSNLVIVKRINNVSTKLSVAPFPAQNNTFYTLRFRVFGTSLFAKAWASTNAEPANWMINTTDSSLTSGQGGVRVLILFNDTIKVTSFLETAVNNTMQP